MCEAGYSVGFLKMLLYFLVISHRRVLSDFDQMHARAF